MIETKRRLLWAAGLMTSLLAACGGGTDATDVAKAGASQVAKSKSVRIAAVSDIDTEVRDRTASVRAGGESAKRSLFVVQMADAPAATFDGDVAGYRATRPARGAKLDSGDADVARYVDYLRTRHDTTLASVGTARKVHTYGYVFNGFAAELTDAQAAKLLQTPGVLSVVKNEIRTYDTSLTPSFLGLDARNGLWRQLGGVSRDDDDEGAGENIVVGVVDGGIWPEHPSFSDRDSRGRRIYKPLRGWKGICQTGEEFTARHCNNKLIGARFYNEGMGGNAGVDADLPYEFNSPRDYDGHGSHTASTAAGNYGVKVTGDLAVFGSISGMAPRARISVYKACWTQPDTGTGSCATVDTLAAIDQAVADGVDVINYSISGSRTNFRDPVEIAFLNAADAGIFVAASAGNAGPTASTVAHPSPWVTTVAAGTTPRTGVGSVTLGNGASFTGSSYSFTSLSGVLADAGTLGLATAPAAQALLCAPDSLDPAKVAGKVVACKRGGFALVDKTDEVKRAGGIGAVIYNDPAGATNTLAIFHAVPTVHVDAAAGAAIVAYVGSAGDAASVTLLPASLVNTLPAPLTAGFSSRGPLIAGDGNLLKPDLMAPGNEILAAVSPAGNAGRLYDLFSGTSMSSPHVAGLAALLRQKHPDWSPMAIKSALMTSAYDVLDGPSGTPSVLFSQGAGHVRPNSAADPGLVYDSSFTDWLGFLCGTQLPAGNCTAAGVPVLDPSDFNSPSIAIGGLTATKTITRRVTNVSTRRLTMTAAVSGLAGISATVSPATLRLRPGETASYTVTFATTTAAPNVYVGGFLTWSGNGYSVRSPIVVRPKPLAAPAQVSGSYSVTFGYTGPFTATARGMVPAALTDGTISNDPDQNFDPAVADGTVAIQVVVPAGSTYARFTTFDADLAAGSDIDMYVVNAAGVLVGASAGATAAEEVNLTNPAAGTYTVYLHGFSLPGGSSAFRMHHWVLGSTAAGNMTVTAPAAATIGTSANIGLAFSGLTSGTRYLGSVAYAGAAGLPAPTIVRVDAP